MWKFDAYQGPKDKPKNLFSLCQIWSIRKIVRQKPNGIECLVICLCVTFDATQSRDDQKFNILYFPSFSFFICREYPCDHYTSVINVTLLMTGCPRVDVHMTAVQLLQVLDKRFFGNVGPLQCEGDKGESLVEM